MTAIPPDARPSGPPSHYPALDGLRAVAVLLVLCHHFPLVFDRSLQDSSWMRWTHGGWIGVDLFFVLSGFLITGLLLKARGSVRPLRTFWMRRILRIFPLFYAYLLVLAGVLLWRPDWLAPAAHPRTILEWLPFFTYLGNFSVVVNQWTAGEFMVLWSLAVEEQFYLFWPLVVLGASSQWLRRWCWLGIVLAALSRVIAAATGGILAVYMSTPCRLDTLLVGALLALAVHEGGSEALLARCERLSLPAVLLLTGALVLPGGVLEAAQFSPLKLLLAYPLLAVAGGCLVGACLRPTSRVARCLQHPRLQAIGRLSYAIYLLHWGVGTAVRHALGLTGVSSLSAGLVIAGLWVISTLAAAWVVHHLVERPFLKLKRRWPTSSEA